MVENRKQRQKEQRAARKEAERKAQARKEIIKRIGTAVGLGATVAVIFILVPFFSGDNEALPASYQALRDQPTACGADAPDPRTDMSFSAPVDQNLSGIVTAVMATSCGDITIELDADAYPETVNSFVFLAREGFYDGVAFHRIVEGFMVQGGDPTGSGSGGPGYDIGDEFPAGEFSYAEGVVAMANAGRGTTGSQFFIVSGPEAAALSATFNVLGTVIGGSDAVEAIQTVPVIRGVTREVSSPTETVYIDSIEITTGS